MTSHIRVVSADDFDLHVTEMQNSINATHSMISAAHSNTSCQLTTFQSQIDTLNSAIAVINHRLSILTPDPVVMQKHVALQHAYEEYLILEKLLTP